MDKTCFIFYSRNDGYKEKERILIHLKTVLETFDEVIYVDWNSETQSLLYEIIDEIPKTGRLKHFVISPHYHKLLTNNNPDVQRCNNVLSVNLALRRTDADWITVGNVDVIPPTKEELHNFIKKSDPNTFYTFSRRETDFEQVLKNQDNLEEYRKHITETTPERRFPAKVTPNDNYSLINCCGDFQMAHSKVWNSIKGLEQNMIYSCYVDTNVQKKAVLKGFGLEAVYDVPVFHMSHTKNSIAQGGDASTVHESFKKPPKFNDPWHWIEYFTETENDEDWGLADIEIEYETI